MELISAIAFVSNHWDTIGLIVSNVIALFMQSPLNKKE